MASMRLLGNSEEKDESVSGIIEDSFEESIQFTIRQEEQKRIVSEP